MSNITPDETVLHPYAASTSTLGPTVAQLNMRPSKTTQESMVSGGADRVSVSLQARSLRAETEARPARAQRNYAGAYVSIERLARIKQAYEARRIRPSPEIIASHLLDERRWL